MKKILRKCEQADLEYLSDVLNNVASLTNDKRRVKLLRSSEASEIEREELISIIDKQIKYFGSSDAAYLGRKIARIDGGVSAHEIIDDVSKKLKVKLKKGGSVESRLESLAAAVVEKELSTLPPEKLVSEFKKMGLDSNKSEFVLSRIKANSQVMVLPILVEVVGPKAALAMVETIIISMLTQFIGREAAKHLVREISKRNPWMLSLSTFVWYFSAAWVAFDLQGPAFRKTVPITLYLGMVALRDGLVGAPMLESPTKTRRKKIK